MLKCPNDATELVEIAVEDVPVAQCPTCKGHWLHYGDLETLSEHHGELEQPVFTGNVLAGESARACPLDANMMQLGTFTEHHNLRVDQCPVCRGIWLDRSELATVLSLRDADVNLTEPTLDQRAMLFLYQLTDRPPLI